MRPSLLVTGVVLVVLFAPRFDDARTGSPYLFATLFVLALYASVLLHEVAHVAAARGFGMRVPRVTLHLLGGETAIEGESRSPWQELVTSAVGPLASLAIGLVAHAVVPPEPGVARDLVWSVGWVNLLVAAFNVLPGLPLDGGRMLRAVIWWITGSERLGIVVAGWIGRACAVALAVVVVVRLVTGDPWGRTWFVDVLVAGFVAAFLWVGSSAALRAADRSARINGLSAEALAEPLEPGTGTDDAWPTLPVDARGTVLLRAMAARPSEGYVLVDPQGRPVGVLRSAAVDDAYRKEP